MNGAPITTLVVDDEPLARRRLARLLARESGFTLLGECASAAEALQMELPAPELVLLDVRMPVQDGFALLQRWREQGVSPCVVFVTAYSEHAVLAFDFDAVDYLLKPFDEERFRKAAERARTAVLAARARRQQAGEAGAGDSGNWPLRGGHAERLLVAEDGKVLFLPVREVEFVQSAGKYVKVFAQGRCHLMRQPMHELEARLDPRVFVRVHRTSIVNVGQIVEMHPLFHGDCELVLRRGTRLPLSRRYRGHFERFLVAG
jgi:two-component system, LytTR family, response regulator